MTDNIDEKFKNHEIELLIGAPLKAVVDAQGLLASDVADFIAKVSITDTSDSIVGKWDNVPDLSSEKVNVSFDMDVKESSEDDETKKNDKF